MAALHGVIPERGDRLLPAVSALLAISAFPPLHLLIPSFVALVPLAVWVADQDAGVARRVAVETGRVGSNGTVEVKSGLTAASRLISSGREELEDGDRIRVTGEEE